LSVARYELHGLYVYTDEWKQQNAERMREQWSDPNNERRKRVSEATKKRWEEFRKNKDINKDK